MLGSSSSLLTLTDYNYDEGPHLKEIAPGFFNLRTPFRRLMGLLDIGTQMSFIKLSSGKFVAVSTVELTPSMKKEIDVLTNNGELLEAVLGVHPYHTLYFKSFYAMYPNAKYYGCPRHLRQIPEIPWAGDFRDESTLQTFLPEIDMRIPDGSEFINPLPERTNHFSNVFVFHKASKTIHVDDTLLIAPNPSFLMKLTPIGSSSMHFHPSITGPGLYPTPEAPQQFYCWLEKLMRDWDFENVSSAHNGVLLGGAKEKLRDTMNRYEPKMKELVEKRLKGEHVEMENGGKWSGDLREACECG
ncbi:hypothetical protein HDV05_005566 [Chytridiales sp. JEL 0842]|nr:hypothetical protein HDV05_005566 [Chytridiales sp. JEL 0842]